MKKKKYNMGGSVKNYIEQPSEVLADYKTQMADDKFHAALNPFSIGLETLAQFAPMFQSTLGSMGQGKSAGGVKDGLTSIAEKNLAFGGVATSVPVEIEGDEIIKPPQGKGFKAQGPKHEKGGIKAMLPEGTEVFSDRIKVGGKTIAEHVEKDIKNLEKISKLLAKNPTDALLKQTEKRVNASNEMKQQVFMNLQNAYDSIESFSRGGIVSKNNVPAKGTTKREGSSSGGSYAYGGLVEGDEFPPYLLKQPTIPMVGAEFPPSPVPRSLARPMGPMESLSYSGSVNDYTGLMPKSSAPVVSETPDKKTFGQKVGDFFGNMNTTAGDVIGTIGTGVSTFAPLVNTLRNRATDTPNINAFSNFGEDALETIDQSKQYVNQVRDEQLQNARLQKTGAIKRGRNTARSVNTSRALDIAGQQVYNQAESTIFQNAASQMLSILGQEAGLENQRDFTQMRGEQTRDFADRADNDNFYTQLGLSLSNMGTGIQAMGKNTNQMKYREDSLKMIEKLKEGGVDMNTIRELLKKMLADEELISNLQE